jgi:hypothetical protein
MSRHAAWEPYPPRDFTAACAIGCKAQMLPAKNSVGMANEMSPQVDQASVGCKKSV